MTQLQDAASAGPGSGYPVRGQVLRDFALPSAAGKQVQLSDCRGRANLVVVLAGARGSRPRLELLRQLASRHAAILEQETQVMAVLCCPREQAQAIKARAQLPFIVLADSDGAVHRSLGAFDHSGLPRLAVYVTDRYGEVFAAWRTATGDASPTAQEILEWLEFVNRQCPECFPPEWPV